MHVEGQVRGCAEAEGMGIFRWVSARVFKLAEEERELGFEIQIPGGSEGGKTENKSLRWRETRKGLKSDV